MTITFPGESAAYRTARQSLLQAEIALRAQIEEVARQRRALPPGGLIPTDYHFTTLENDQTPLSSLFIRSRQTLALYSLMYRPDADAPCPMCVSMLDGLADQARHIGQMIDLAIVSAATPQQLADLSARRGWGDLTLLSAQGTTYLADYHGETPDGAQLPMMNVFTRSDDDIRHFWGAEMLFAPSEAEPRHMDQLWPLWNMLDLTPDGRDTNWHPALAYGT